MSIILNGGNPTGDCPRTWNEAELLIEKANKGKSDSEPKWKFDCGFKLDFDGPLISVSSRFYPPKEHYGEGWNGTLTIHTGLYRIEKKFDYETFEELKLKVEGFISYIEYRTDKFVENLCK